MKTQALDRRTCITAILLVALVVPRCLMAADMASSMANAPASKLPCHGVQEASESPNPDALVTCAQQCELSLVGSLSVKDADIQLEAPALVASINARFPDLLLSHSTMWHQSWPPNHQLLLPSTAELYLDTARLRL